MLVGTSICIMSPLGLATGGGGSAKWQPPLCKVLRPVLGRAGKDTLDQSAECLSWRSGPP